MARRDQNIGRDQSVDVPIRALYAEAQPARRAGPLFSAFPYPTKISPEAIALFIATHTRPGCVVFDGFAGSGTTGLAALLCDDPPQSLREHAARRGLNAQWGPRNTILCEIGVLGAFVARTMAKPPNPATFQQAAQEVLEAANKEDGWMYGAHDPEGQEGVARHFVWSDTLECPDCGQRETLWDACVSRRPARIAKQFSCPSCGHAATLGEVRRTLEATGDQLLAKSRHQRARRLAWLYGRTGKRNWSRPICNDDLRLLERIENTPLPASVPVVEIPWGDLYRRGYHQGMTHLHHFYTRRNLIVFGKLWERIGTYPDDLRDALQFWLLSYNASHATIMTRVVAKTAQKELVVTSAQPGVLYVSGLPVEKHLIDGLRRKLRTIAGAFAMIYRRRGTVDVLQQSGSRTTLPDSSVDYVFTDPPFGGNIPYAELNFINEAWLGRYTDRRDEAIVSASQGKSLMDYEQALTRSFAEIARILKPHGQVTVVFHSASAAVWSAFQSAYTNAGLEVRYGSVLDKHQGSFKQVTTHGAVHGDPMLLLAKRSKRTTTRGRIDSPRALSARLRRAAEYSPDPTERTPQRLYSRFVTYYLVHHQPVPMDAPSFYRMHAEASGNAPDQTS